MVVHAAGMTVTELTEPRGMPGNSPHPSAADYQQLGTFGLLTQPPGRLIAEEQSL